MKIAMVTSQYLPVISGVSFYLKQLCESLVKRGYDITVYTPGSKNLKKTEIIKGVLIKRFLPFARLPRGYEIFLGIEDSIIKDSPDIVHSHHYGYYPCTAGLNAACKLAVPHVFTPVLHPPKFGLAKASLFRLYHRFHGKNILKKSGVVLALSRHEVTELVKLGADKEKIEIIYNPVSSAFSPLQKIKKGKLVMFVGPLGRTKGADVAFKIMKKVAAKLDDVKFLLVGKGVLEGKFIAESKDFRGRFLFKHGLTDSQLASCYRKSMVLLSPTPYEAFGRAIAEAQACGTAVVATRVGSVPEIVLNEKTGVLVDFGEWDEMQERLEYLLNSPKKAKTMGISGSKRISKIFSEDSFTRKHERIYARLLQ